MYLRWFKKNVVSYGFALNQYTQWCVLYPHPDPASKELLEARAGQMDPTSGWVYKDSMGLFENMVYGVYP